MHSQLGSQLQADVFPACRSTACRSTGATSYKPSKLTSPIRWMDNRWQTLCEVREYKCGKVWIPRVSVHSVCALCLCTLSVHFIYARCLCTLSVHVVCARCLCTLVDSCREGSHRTTRRRNACHLASPSCHRIPGGSRRPVFACTCCADMHCPTCAGPGLVWS